MRNSSRKTVLKRVLAYALALALTLSVITVPSTDAYAASGSVKSVTVTNLPAKQVTIKKGKSFVLKTKVTTSGKISKAVVYKSSNSKVAKVTKTGKITAVKKGSTYVTVYAKANKKKVCKVKVTVGTPVSSVKLSKASATIKKGKTLTLKATVSPKSASNKTLTWKSSNKKVATVSSKGVVKAVNAGTAKITATANDGSGKKYTCTVKVNIPVSSVKLNKVSVELLEGETAPLSAKVAPSNASNKSVKWSTSNAKVATVSAGKVTAKSAGTATITAAAADGSGKKAVCKITVKAKSNVKPEVKVSKITLSLADDTIYVGEKTKVSVVVEPEDATNKEVVYSVSDETVATIDAKTGVIEAKKEGSVDIIVTATDGSDQKGVAKLFVEGVPSIQITKKSVSLTVDQETTLGVNDPTAAVKYISSNEKVVSVINSATGQIKAVAAGRATITVSLVDMPEVKDTCNVVVMNDDTVMITAFTRLVQGGFLTVNLSMMKDNNNITNDMLLGTELYIINEDTGNKITARYSTGSLTKDSKTSVISATYVFDSELLETGTYVLDVPSDSIYAIKTESDSSLKNTVNITRYKSGISGVVYDEDGEPVEGAIVQCKAGADISGEAITDDTGEYEIEVDVNTKYTIEVTKKGYFDTSIEQIKVNTDSVTANPVIMEAINENNLALYGHVLLDREDSNKLNTNVLPKATLYVMKDSKWEAISTVTVSSDGYFAFMNNGRFIEDNKDYLVSDETENYMFKRRSSNHYIFAANDTNRLSTDKQYRVVISKDLGMDNDNAVYTSAEISNQMLSTTNKVTKLKNVTLNRVAKFKGLTIPGGEISWGQESCRPTGSETTIDCTIYSGDGVVTDDGAIYTKSVDGIKVKVDTSKQFSDKTENVKIIKADELTLPAGNYYAVISTDKCADVNIPFTVDATGSALQLTNIAFNPSSEYGLKIQIDVDKAYFVNEGLKVEDKLKLKDLAGVSGTANAYLYVDLYEVSAKGEEIFIKRNRLDNFEVLDNGDGKYIEQKLSIAGLVNGNTYRVRFDSPILSLTSFGSNENEKYSDKYGYYEFKYVGTSGNKLIPSLAIQANIQNVSLTSNAQFENFDVTKPLFVNKIALADKDGNEIKEYTQTINRYFSCGNKAYLSEDDKELVKKDKDNIYGGGDLITDGIDVSEKFSNINPGNYTINISINGYAKLSVPVNGLDIVGLSQGNYKVSVENIFKTIENTNINGTLINTNKDVVTDPVYITVLDSNGVVVATGSSNSDGTYKIVNGTDDKNPNVITEGETYTLVFRSKNYEVTEKTIAPLVAGGNKQDNLELNRITGSINATIYEKDTKKELKRDSEEEEVGVYLLDSKYVDDPEKFVNPKVQEDYEKLEYKGKYRMIRSSSNLTYWHADDIAKGSYTLYVEGNKYYNPYRTKNSVSIGVDGSVVSMGEIEVPLLVDKNTKPVYIDVHKVKAATGLNIGGYDVARIYAVDKNGTETYVTSIAHYSSINDYAFGPVDLEYGTYRAYVYSRNYVRKFVDFDVYESSGEDVHADISLAPTQR